MTTTSPALRQLAHTLVDIEESAVERSTRPTIRDGAVVDVDPVTNVVTVEVDGQRFELQAQAGSLPEVGHVLHIPMNGTQPVTTLPPSGPLESDPPAQVTGLVVTSGVRSLLIEWNEVPDVDTINNRGWYEIQVDTDPLLLTPDTYRKAGTTQVTTGLTTGTLYYVRVRAIDYAGTPGPWSVISGGTPAASITETDIAPDSISTPHLQANVVTAEKIVALLQLLVGQSIESLNFPGFGAGGPGFGMRGDGLIEVYDALVRGNLALGIELLSNSGFEPVGLLTPWTLESGDSATRVTTQFDTGVASARLQENSGTRVSIKSERVDTIAGRTLHNRVRLRPAGPVGDRSSYQAIRFYDAVGTLLQTTERRTPIYTRDAWIDAYATANAPDDTVEADVEVGMERPTNGSLDVYVDNVRFREGSRIEGAALIEAVADKLLVTERLTVKRVTYDPVGCALQRTVGQTVGNAAISSMQWNSKVFDSYGNMHSLIVNPHLITIREDGWYTTVAYVIWNNDPDAGFSGLTSLNLGPGTPYAFRNTHYTGTAAVASQFMVAGQTIALEMYQATGASRSVTGGIIVSRGVMG